MSDSAMIRSLMKPLIDKAGGYTKAATLIDLQLGNKLYDGWSKRGGTIHKRQEESEGNFLEWPMVEVWALERALGDRSVSRWRTQTCPDEVDPGSILDTLSEACAENGEAFGAVAAFLAGKGSREDALREVEQSITANKRLKASVLDREAE